MNYVKLKRRENENIQLYFSTEKYIKYQNIHQMGAAHSSMARLSEEAAADDQVETWNMLNLRSLRQHRAYSTQQTVVKYIAYIKKRLL